jgi:hypothetical protein
MKLTKLLLTALCWVYILLACPQIYGVPIPFEKFVEGRMSRLRTDDIRLRAIYESQLKERHQLTMIDSSDDYKRARNALFSSIHDAAEIQYLLEALDKAYANEPKQWGTIAAILEIAIVGTDEEQIVKVCQEILENVRTVPDDASDVIWGTAQYLLVKRELEYVDLVVRCVYADYVGVKDESTPESANDSDRNQLRDAALSALTCYLPLDTKLQVFQKLEQDHSLELAEKQPGSWRYGIARSIAITKEATEIRLSRESVAIEQDKNK